jgi:hypothetical protein
MTATQTSIFHIIDELHREAARQMALAVQPEYKRTVRGSARCYERARECIQAADLLLQEVGK